MKNEYYILFYLSLILLIVYSLLSYKVEFKTISTNVFESNSNRFNSYLLIEKKEDKSLETLFGNLSGYGPDCYGCSTMLTASGRYVGNGNIYYEDSTYGKIRIVAGDVSYPFGTIIKISNVDYFNDISFYAIVLDRGGAIGKNKPYLFDLLFINENEAYNLGVETNIKFEIVRLGY